MGMVVSCKKWLKGSDSNSSVCGGTDFADLHMYSRLEQSGSTGRLTDPAEGDISASQ